jgi:hypothetical protein
VSVWKQTSFTEPNFVESWYKSSRTSTLQTLHIGRQ